ncbi:MAG: DUF1353 domain-containing protein [Pseudomonadota bacterium]|nr:DUF1353 domain-containing protein [Pseudomonadota bacterium]
MSDGYGQFDGEVVAKWCRDPNQPDRNMVLMEKLTYVDPKGNSWVASEHRKINGASIPDALWSAWLGTPFVGDYRRATVVHDIACDDRAEPSAAVHKMFYYAMRCDGVPKFRAVPMYVAVSLFGPRWDAAGLLPSESIAPEKIWALEQAVEQAFGKYGFDADIDVLEQAVRESLGK